MSPAFMAMPFKLLTVMVGVLTLVRSSPGLVPLSLALAKAGKPIWVASTVKV